MSSKKERTLTGRQLLFVKALLADPLRRASLAYIAAGYNVKSNVVAEVNACRLLGDARVQAAIAEYDAKIVKKYERTAEKVLDRLQRGAQLDIRKLYHLEGEKEGRLKLPHELDDEAAALVTGTKYSKDGVFMGYQTLDVKGCSELLGRNFKLFTDKIEIDGEMGVRGEMSDLEVANRLLTLIDKLETRARGGADGSGGA